MTASSSYNVFHGAFLARLHRTRTGRYMGAWVARIRNSNQWLQVALGRPMTITGIATQGRHDANQWVTRYLVAFSQDNMHFEYYMEYGTFKVKLCDGEISNNSLPWGERVFIKVLWGWGTLLPYVHNRCFLCLKFYPNGSFNVSRFIYPLNFNYSPYLEHPVFRESGNT